MGAATSSQVPAVDRHLSGRRERAVTSGNDDLAGQPLERHPEALKPQAVEFRIARPKRVYYPRSSRGERSCNQRPVGVALRWGRFRTSHRPVLSVIP